MIRQIVREGNHYAVYLDGAFYCTADTYGEALEEIKAYEKGSVMEMITEEMAISFYHDLCGTYNGNANKTCQGIASAEHIAETMQISEERAMEFCNAMIQYGITERQGGAYVI